MKRITKRPEPRLLTQHRQRQFSDFDNMSFDAKEALRQSLLAEQGYICCYCMKRIPERTSPNMKVEHFKCQANYNDLQLNYSNLFGACLGNEGQPKKMQTCDTKKSNFNLTIDLISDTPNCETLFKYTADGEIRAINDNEEIQRQLDVVLNLNMQTLKDGRREVYLEVQQKVEKESKKYTNGQLKTNFFEQEKSKWLSQSDDKFKPYCMVAVYYLTKKIRQNQR